MTLALLAALLVAYLFILRAFMAIRTVLIIIVA